VSKTAKKKRKKSNNDRYGLRRVNSKRRRKIRERVLIKCDHKCVKCGHEGSKKNPLTIDHIIPVVLGGRNIISNFQILCEKCAHKKGLKENKFGPGQEGKNHAQ
jgi:5-methylcytosine-specific restriction endonuclease McrA